MKQISMVSLYGQKRGDLERLIKKCWEMISVSIFRRVFEPYHINQIHGTIIGMEKLIGFDDPFNANIWQVSGNKVTMMYAELLNIIARHLPMTIRFGGFDKDYKEFTSFGKTPYERSFQVQWPTFKFTLIGWPHKDLNFTSKQILWDPRHEIETRCNIKHKYENDNDLFMVLGGIEGLQLLTDSELDELKSKSASLEETVREYLRKNPVDVEITAEQVFLAQYSRETLSLDSTNVYCIQNPGIHADFIQSLYSEG